MSEPLEETYFNWLFAKVKITEAPNYVSLLRILHRTEFVWVVDTDENRAEDGLELRLDFFRELYLKKDNDWFETPVSVLEVLVAFAKRASFQTDMPVKDWFWIFMNNLGLDGYLRVSDFDIPVIEDILNTFLWRRYPGSGHGGLFPMNYTSRNQQKVELWFQFCEYLDDQGLL